MSLKNINNNNKKKWKNKWKLIRIKNIIKWLIWIIKTNRKIALRNKQTSKWQ